MGEVDVNGNVTASKNTYRDKDAGLPAIINRSFRIKSSY